MKINEIARILLHFATFGFSFYALSGLDAGKVMLPGPQRTAKSLTLLVLLSLAIGYLSAQFILAIVYRF